MMMTCREVAEALGVSERSVWRWSATGVLPPPVQIGAARRWREQTIREWARQREQEVLARQEAQAADRQARSD